MRWTIAAALATFGAGARGRGGAGRRTAQTLRLTAIVSLGDSFISGEGGRWLGNGSEPFGTRSGTDRAAFDCDGWGAATTTRARLRCLARRSDCHRSDVAPIRERAGRRSTERVNLACSGATAGERLARGIGGRPTSASRRRPTAGGGRAARRRADGGRSRWAPTTSASASWWPAARSTGRAAPSGDPVLCRDDAQAERRSGPAGAWSGASRRALRGVRGHAGERRIPALATTACWRSATRRRSRRGAGSATRRRAGAGSTEGGCPVWNADADWAAGAGRSTRSSRRCAAPLRRPAPSSSTSATRSTATSSAIVARAGSASKGPYRRRAPSGCAASPSSRARAGSRCTPTPTASVRSASASVCSTGKPARQLRLFGHARDGATWADGMRPSAPLG